jgi:hypothetical protein
MEYHNFHGHVKSPRTVKRWPPMSRCLARWLLRHVGPDWRLSYQMKIFMTLYLVRVLCTIHKPPTHRQVSDSLSSEVLLGDFTIC